MYRYKLPIGNSLHCCILTYKYNNFKFLAIIWFYLFNPKQLSPVTVRHCLSDSSIDNTSLP